jgi:hypothetical protein
LKLGVVLALCYLEKAFPPSLFDLMTHLTLHLVDELDNYGLVHYSWVYPIKQALKDLKGYVRNMCKARGQYGKGIHLQ